MTQEHGGSSATGGPDGGEGERDAVRMELQRLREAVEAVARSAERHARVAELLHDENQRLRRGEAEAFFAAARLGLIRHYDQLNRQARKAGSREDTFVAELLARFAADAVDLLERLGVSRIGTAPGDRFDEEVHQPSTIVPPYEAAPDGTVVEIIGAGFTVAGTSRVLKKAEVVLARTGETSPAPATPNAPAAPTAQV
ncbi:nucleotide exchange factor GrpE [Yinghuangia soli]|uniref:Nucleotide exchange factor GrpE n=1 Tax=Yinghuangia soli TaxID=2908204 RepID=A0AA41PUT6_9ACTN|nr:nucleotide exchange factor GrpE [Yinghuangia soli]MCF2526106.1 nucleotide exchange factor GrpE [Yinghuangia soli]